jgi:hypothetical protein
VRPGYVRVRGPMPATRTAGAAPPREFLAGLVEQQLRYRHPAGRRFGAAVAAAARRDLPGPARRGLTAGTRSQRPDLDRLQAQLAAGWAGLAGRARELPTDPGPLSLLELRRRSARTVLVFGTGPDPLVVAKLPGDPDVLATEERLLARLVPSGVAPRPLGRQGEAVVQEGIPGRPPALVPVRVDDAAGLDWPADHGLLMRGLADLASVTAADGSAAELGEPLTQALAHPLLDAPTRAAVRSARDRLAGLDRVVVRHGDLSGQNWLVAGDRLGGVVDWETGIGEGAPGLDAWHAALSWFEQGVGLARWSPGSVVGAFTRAWRRSPYFAAARSAARTVAAAGGADPACSDALELAFFARRLGRRMSAPGRYRVGADVAAAQLVAMVRTGT